MKSIEEWMEFLDSLNLTPRQMQLMIELGVCIEGAFGSFNEKGVAAAFLYKYQSQIAQALLIVLAFALVFPSRTLLALLVFDVWCIYAFLTTSHNFMHAQQMEQRFPEECRMRRNKIARRRIAELFKTDPSLRFWLPLIEEWDPYLWEDMKTLLPKDDYQKIRDDLSNPSSSNSR